MAAPLEGGANDPRPYGDGRRAPAATEVRRESGNRLTVMVLCLASLIAVVGITIVSIALPAIRRDLGFSDSGVQWILNGYVLAFGGLLLLFGRVGDLWGRRRLFVAGLASFAVAGLIGGLAWEPWILVAARCLQGAAAAAFIPASLSLLTTAFTEGEERNRAIGLYGAMAALGFVVAWSAAASSPSSSAGGGSCSSTFPWRWRRSCPPTVLWPRAGTRTHPTPLTWPERHSSSPAWPLCSTRSQRCQKLAGARSPRSASRRWALSS